MPSESQNSLASCLHNSPDIYTTHVSLKVTFTKPLSIFLCLRLIFWAGVYACKELH